MKNLFTESYRTGKVIRFVRNSIWSWRDKFPHLVGLSSERIEMPDFLITGFAKCGTWSLAHDLNEINGINLRTNPWFLNKGEVRFFSKNFERSLSQYSDLFRQREPGELLFEKSPDYAGISELRIRLIKRLNPRIRILFMVRDPVERVFSNAKMDLCRSRNRAFSDVPDDDFLQFYNKNSDTELNYEVSIERWSSIIESKQIMVTILEKYSECKTEELQRILNFLGIRRTTGIKRMDSQATNTTERVAMPEHHRALICENQRMNIDYYRKLLRNTPLTSGSEYQ